MVSLQLWWGLAAVRADDRLRTSIRRKVRTGKPGSAFAIAKNMGDSALRATRKTLCENIRTRSIEFPNERLAAARTPPQNCGAASENDSCKNARFGLDLHIGQRMSLTFGAAEHRNLGKRRWCRRGAR